MLAQCVVRYGFFELFGVSLTLSTLGFIFLVVATVFIAAGGNVINDIYDVNADRINTPKKVIVGKIVPERAAKTFYFILTFIGLGAGFILSTTMGQPLYMIVFLISALCLYLYSKVLKKVPLIGNLIVSILVGLALYVVGIFEIYPVIDTYEGTEYEALLQILLDFSIFAAVINLLRELVKDIEDMQGDHVARYKTIPLLFGAQRTAKITSVLTLGTLTYISWYAFNYLYDEKIAVATLIFGVVVPLSFIAMKLWEARHKKEYSKISLWLKIVMLIGICTIPLITYTLKNAG